MNIKLLASALLITALFSGCLAGGDDAEADEATDATDDTDATDTSDDGTDTGGPGPSDSGTGGPPPSQTGGGGGGDNTPPEASLIADAVTGPAPLMVVFTADASDPDGDTLTFSLDMDGDGVAEVVNGDLPLSANFTYPAAGLYVALFNVSDGTANDAASVEINVTEAVGGATVLYFVGDGSTTVITDPTTASPDNQNVFQAAFGLSSTGNGGMETTYATLAPQFLNTAQYEHPWLPNYVGAEKVTLTGGPITVHVFGTFLGGGATTGGGLQANLYDEAGNIIASTTDGVVPGADPQNVQEVVVTLAAATPGTYAGLRILVAPIYFVNDMGLVEWVWGTDEFNARIELAPGDKIG